MRNKTLITAVALFLVILLTAPATMSQDYDGVLKALSKLEKSIEKVKQQYAKPAQSRKQYTGVDGMLSESDLQPHPLYSLATDLEYFTRELSGMIEETKVVEKERPKNPPSVGHGKVSFSGFVHEWYYNEAGDNSESTFRSRRARLSVKGNINKYTGYKFQGEFAGTPKLLDGMLTLSPNNYWTLQVGQYKPPFGADFLVSATSMPFVNKSKVSGIGTDRDIGACLVFDAPTSGNIDAKISAGIFNGSGINTTDANSDKNIVARAEIGFSKWLCIAPNVIIGKNNNPDLTVEDYKAYGGSLQWTWQNETAEFEYIQSEEGDTKMAGWYVWGGHTFQTNYAFLKEIQLLARYENYDVDTDISDNAVNRTTIGANLYIDKKYTKIQLNYQLNGEEGTSVDNNEFLVNFQVAF